MQKGIHNALKVILTLMHLFFFIKSEVKSISVSLTQLQC